MRRFFLAGAFSALLLAGCGPSFTEGRLDESDPDYIDTSDPTSVNMNDVNGGMPAGVEQGTPDPGGP